MSISIVAATINMDAVVHSAIFLAFAGVGAMLVYQGFSLICQAKNKFQGFIGVFTGIVGAFTVCWGLANAFPHNPNAGTLPSGSGDTSSVITDSGSGDIIP
jgi:hypothetical protein